MDIVVNSEIDLLPENGVLIADEGHFFYHLMHCVQDVNDGLSVASLLSHYHELPGTWVIVSPIYWQATHNDAMMIASGHSLPLSDEESRLWFEAFQAHLKLVNMDLYYHDAHTWLLHRDDMPPISARPTHLLKHQSLMSELKQLDDSLFWIRFITESQMFFSSHPLNNARTNVYPINGIWVWGSGACAPPNQKPMIYFEDDLYPYLKQLSTNTHLYSWQALNDLNRFSDIEHSVLVLQDLTKTQRLELEERVKKYVTRWYWNNKVYTLPKRRAWQTWIRRSLKK